ncbi:MAG: PBP1A family penicillin-binding protein [bacterium]|nr:PBP1A family penicillin-binding protein [bacterium]
MKKRIAKKLKKAIFSHQFLFIGTGVGFLCIATLALWTITLDIPDVSLFTERKIEQSTKIYDNTGKVLLYDVHGSVKRTVIPFEDIPRNVKNATVAIEDSDFYNHHGISVEGIFRAFFTNILSGTVAGQGGSTITQQLIKNALLTNKKTYTRKIKEAILALKLERILSKEDILNLYLNEIPYGGQTYGIEAASQTFFGKPAKELTLAQAAYVTSLPQSPTYYSPYGLHRDELEKRKDTVLRRMNELGFISKEEAESAMQEHVQFIGRADESLKAPHFVMYVLDVLGEKYGRDTVDTGGLKVTTTLNWELQQKAEEITKQFVEDEKEKFNVFNAGMIGLDPKTGAIQVMVGSKNFWGEPEPEGCTPGKSCLFDPQVNTPLSLRQPGSSFKPIVYATALMQGYTPETVVFDLPTEFNSSCNPDIQLNEYGEDSECYAPKNYDSIFRGPITFRDALAQSVNVPSVKVLYLAGLTRSLSTAQTLGISTLNDPNRYGLTLVLGGGEVTLLEITGAYSVFANNGIRNTPVPILKVETNEGKILEEYTPPQNQVLPPEIAHQINSMLSDNAARTPAFGAQSFLHFPGREVAVKTGTTNDYKDAWVIGYTPNFSLGVWFGNNDNTPMEKQVAGFIAAPLWNAFFAEVFKTLPKESFTQPSPQNIQKPVLRGEWRGSYSYIIDSISGKLATEYTPQELQQQKVITQIHSILYWVDKNNPQGNIPENPERDSQFTLWEYPVRTWMESQHIQEQTTDNIPKEFDTIHRPENKPVISFLGNTPTRIYPGQSFTFSVQTQSTYPIEHIDTFIGNYFLGSVPVYQNKNTHTITKEVPFLDAYEDTMLLIRIYDSVGNSQFIETAVLVCRAGDESQECN